MGQYLGENEVQYSPGSGRSRGPDVFTRGFSDTAVLHAGRARALAGAAEQTEINMFLESVAELDASIGGGFDQMDSAARRFRFEAGGAISRTLIQAQAAMNALIEFGEIESGDLCLGATVSVRMGVFQWRPSVV